MKPTNTIVPQQQQKPEEPTTFSSYLMKEKILDSVKRAVGEKDSQQFITSIVSAVNANNDLSKCLYTTILSAALVGKALNLSPSPVCGQFFMVPFKNNKRSTPNNEVYEAQFVLGYKGYLQLAYRTGAYKRINAVPIKEGEFISWDPIEEKLTYKLIENDMEREKAKTVGYYAFYEYLSGTRKAIYWSKDKMAHHADLYSPAFSVNATTGRKYNRVSFADYEAGKIPKGTEFLYSSFWYKNFDEMACKTMLRQLISKWGIMSIELEKAFTYDGAVIDEEQQPHFIEDDGLLTETVPVEAETHVETVDAILKPTVDKDGRVAMVEVTDVEAEAQEDEEDIEDAFFG